MARKTPDSLLLFHEDVETGRVFPLIEQYLGLKEPLTNTTLPVIKNNPFVTTSMIEICQAAYERYYYKLKKLPLKWFTR